MDRFEIYEKACVLLRINGCKSSIVRKGSVVLTKAIAILLGYQSHFINISALCNSQLIIYFYPSVYFLNDVTKGTRQILKAYILHILYFSFNIHIGTN